ELLHGVIAHVPYAESGVLDLSVAAADHPAPIEHLGDHPARLGGGDTADCRRPVAFGGENSDVETALTHLPGPLDGPSLHVGMSLPAPLHALLGHTLQLEVECVEQRDCRCRRGLILADLVVEIDEVEVPA